ncbi:MAG: beta-ketoacyl-[acyl-carrier-protein] synthase I [Candidatus Pelagibacterales bacterium]|nr:MAG: beta-ketoacyl-[acyl-carrier-protein] synthase I [Pelagibacterales bacterium]
MRRVVITGLGIVSSLGNNKDEVKSSLYNASSGISFDQSQKEMGFRSQVSGQIDLNLEETIERKFLRFMGDGASYNYIAMNEAIEDSGLNEDEISNNMTGLIMGSGGPSTKSLLRAFDITREKGPKKIGPTSVPKVMCSTNSATLSTYFKIKGINYSISSACSTSAHCIGNAYEIIQMGKQDRIFAGGGEELDWTLSALFDAMPALSSKYNDQPSKSSRAFDKHRDGFVIAGGGGVVVLEDLETAVKRNAKIYAEIVGYGATSDGHDMVQPSGEGAERCMMMAKKDIEKIDYINAHGTSTPVGDIAELKAIKKVFKDDLPLISSTKSLSGHSLGAAGVHESIYTLLMMNNNFVSESANIDELDEEAIGMNILTSRHDEKIDTAMSNSFGFGGTNASLVFKRFEG